MKTTKNLSLIFISVFFITCNLGKSTEFSQDTSQAQAKLLELNRSVGKAKNTGQSKLTQNSPSKEEEEKYETIEGTKNVKAFLVFSSDVTWIKTKAIAIRDHKGNVIPELEGKVRYSYSISPVKLDNEFTKYTMPLVLFETTKGNENLEVESFTLENDSGLDFNIREYPVGLWSWSFTTISIPKTEASSEKGYANTNPFGIIKGNGKAIPALTKSKTVKAKIRVRDKKDNITNAGNTGNKSKTDNIDSSVKEYSILLDSSYLVRLIKETLEKNQGIENTANDFKLEQPAVK
ncbi:p23 cell envelope protein (plasmid) [Borrelia turcica IST7]|uniref:p23 cell envelope protein n=1 Tax=Borrelia turcica IST7 TaxID=1104446 RepID=A0A386PP51_9SPIR|nr:p23 cell envelope protein [Borrelia turcica]AYE36803.1 p23 cell envelope protein [Borrelia turcica IST7]